MVWDLCTKFDDWMVNPTLDQSQYIIIDTPMTSKPLSLSPNLSPEHLICIFDYVFWHSCSMISNRYMKTNELKRELLISLLSQTSCRIGSLDDLVFPHFSYSHPSLNFNNTVFKIEPALLLIFITTILVKATTLYSLIYEMYYFPKSSNGFLSQ